MSISNQLDAFLTLLTGKQYQITEPRKSEVIQDDSFKKNWHILFSFGDAQLGIMQNKLMSNESLFIRNLF